MSTATATQTNKAPEKPTMAAKKVWDFTPKAGKAEDIPATVRTGGAALPFQWDGMKVGSHFTVPVEFWMDRGITKTKATAPLCKDRLRRAFYNWRDKDEKARSKFTLAFSDTFSKDGTYEGSEVYLANAQG